MATITGDAMDIPTTKVADFVINLANNSAIETGTDLYSEILENHSRADVQAELVQDLISILVRQRLIAHQDGMKLYGAYLREVENLIDSPASREGAMS